MTFHLAQVNIALFTPYAFTFRESFPPDGVPEPVRDDGELCPAG